MLQVQGQLFCLRNQYTAEAVEGSVFESREGETRSCVVDIVNVISVSADVL